MTNQTPHPPPTPNQNSCLPKLLLLHFKFNNIRIHKILCVLLKLSYDVGKYSVKVLQILDCPSLF